MNIFALIFFFVMATLAWAQESSFVYNDHGKRDPLWSLVTNSGNIINYDTDLSLSDLTLEGIVVGDKENLAIINGRMVKINDKVGQYFVSIISKNSVILIKDQEKFELKLKKKEE